MLCNVSAIVLNLLLACLSLENVNAGTISVGVILSFMNPIFTIYTAWIIGTTSHRIST